MRVLHRLAVRGVDRPRRGAPHRRLQLPAAALDAHLRLRAGLRARVTGARPTCLRAARSSTTRWWPCRRRGSGVLPPDGSLLTVEPAGAVQLAAPASAATRPPPAAPGPSTRGCHHRDRRNPRRDNGSHDLQSGGRRSPGWSRPTCWRPRGRRAERPAAAARLSDRHPAGPPRRAHGARRRRVRPGPDAEAAQPRTPATGCTTAAPPAGRLPAVAHLPRKP